MEKRLAVRRSYTDEQVLLVIKNGTVSEKGDVAMALGFDCQDYGFAQSQCIRLLQEEDEGIRTNAVIGLAHIARRFGKLDKRTVKPYLLRELRENISGKDLIADAVEQIHGYLKWNVGEKTIQNSSKNGQP